MYNIINYIIIYFFDRTGRNSNLCGQFLAIPDSMWRRGLNRLRQSGGIFLRLQQVTSRRVWRHRRAG